MTFHEIADPAVFAVMAQVLLIDLVLAGDNAVMIGLAANGLRKSERRTAIAVGISVATVLRIALAAVATVLLALPGLSFAGGLLLLWVCFGMWRDLRGIGGADSVAPAGKRSLRHAIVAIIVADVSMSLDNVLAVSGAAGGHMLSLAVGLAGSIALTAVAASAIAALMNRHRWIAYAGLCAILFVAGEMLVKGAGQIIA